MSNAAIAAITFAALAFYPGSTASTQALCPTSTEPGRLVAWGSPTDLLVPLMPVSGEFLSLAAGGSRQTLAIRDDGTLYVNPDPGAIPDIPADLAGLEFCTVGVGRNHGLGIRPNGTILAWPGSARVGAPTAEGFKAVAGAGGFYSIAIDRDRKLVMWGGAGLGVDYAKVVGVGPPIGIQFEAIAARGRSTLVLAVDGNIYGWGVQPDPVAPGVVAGQDFGVFTLSSWTPDGFGHFIAPREAGRPYKAIALGLDLAVALRDDGRVVVWDPSGDMPDAPTDVVFTHIATGNGFVAGIDVAGHLHAWGKPGLAWVNNVPPGLYSAVSAATSHVAAIAIPDTTPPVVTIVSVTPNGLWPPNHKMATAAVTFTADDAASGVLLSGLSVTLHSNQPDNGSGSGNTTGDTNGHDGYTTPVALPMTAIVRNANGSFTATFQVRAENANALPASRIYTVSVVATDNATPPNTSAPRTAQIVVGHGGQ